MRSRTTASWFVLYQSASLPLLRSCSPHELAVIMDSVGGLGVRPGPEWLEALLGAAAAEVVNDSYSPAHVALLLRGLRQVCMHQILFHLHAAFAHQHQISL